MAPQLLNEGTERINWYIFAKSNSTKNSCKIGRSCLNMKYSQYFSRTRSQWISLFFTKVIFKSHQLINHPELENLVEFVLYIIILEYVLLPVVYKSMSHSWVLLQRESNPFRQAILVAMLIIIINTLLLSSLWYSLQRRLLTEVSATEYLVTSNVNTN